MVPPQREAALQGQKEPNTPGKQRPEWGRRVGGVNSLKPQRRELCSQWCSHEMPTSILRGSQGRPDHASVTITTNLSGL